MIAKLPPGGTIARHRDTHPSFGICHRIHVPLQTGPEVMFIIGHSRIEAVEGVAFEINNLEPHEVHNRGERDRIHFIFDYAPR
jgi:aspartyl/asparaginyl beta-hydroxylase (cupin superfamily)